jgi:hypothetical protein
LRPPLQVLDAEHAPAGGPGLITVNHFSRPGFQAWWIPLAVSAEVPAEVHWVMTRAWRFHNRRWSRALLVPAFGWLLGQVARVYGFTPMPAMPPAPAEAAARADAVRALLAYARRTPRPLIGLAPEGRDSPDGRLIWPPPGAGRLMGHLARAGLSIVPTGVYEAGGGLCVHFGPAYTLDDAMPPAPAGGMAAWAASPADRDRQVSRIVMHRIAALLPLPLRGDLA